MAWNTTHLRAEIASEFAILSAGDPSPSKYGMRVYSVRRVYRRVWSRPTIECGTCGARFTPLDARTMYCSRRCAHNHALRGYNARRKAKRLADRSNRVCANPHCAKVFTGYSSRAIYCSKYCSNRWRTVRYQRRRRGKDETVLRLPGRWGRS
jgi:hypothetical protein